VAEFSFDVVSEFDGAELTNAIDQARRETGTRFDFKDTATTFELKGGEIIVESASEDRARAAYQVLVEKAARRNLSPKLFKPGEPKAIGKGRGQIEVKLNAGITDELAKDLHEARPGGEPEDPGSDPGRPAPRLEQGEGRPPVGPKGPPRGRRHRGSPAVHELSVG